MRLLQIEAGGEVIITQLFYDVDRFVKFVKDCRGLGITVPIIPGMPPKLLTLSGRLHAFFPLL